jgi:hypothetical protein
MRLSKVHNAGFQSGRARWRIAPQPGPTCGALQLSPNSTYDVFLMNNGKAL